MTETLTASPKYTRKDFVSPVAPRWCPGCGCYSAFAVLTKVFASLDRPRENYALVSGIGCSSRMPYYANTYGFHTIHGRAPTVATGLKISEPDLSVWVITGDGDALSIGGNHFIHMMRRNVGVKMMLLNNQIYALTKGQASPTTAAGTKTKSTPYGSFENPLRPLTMAIASGATFAARVPDNDVELLTEVLTEAACHEGTAFVEVLLNCVIFNDGAFSNLTEKEARAETTLRLKAGQPLLFGAERNKGLVARRFQIATVQLDGPDRVSPEDLLIHDPADPDPALALALSRLEGPDYPVPMGVFRKVSAQTYEDRILSDTREETFEDVLRGANCWTVTGNGEHH